MTGVARVLLVDDNEVNRAVGAGLARKLGVEVDTVDGGAAALDAMATGSYDLVLLDCRMPGIDGFEVARRRRRAEATQGLARVAIVALTAEATAYERARCEEAGMDGFLGKPVLLDDLRAVFDRWVPPVRE